MSISLTTRGFYVFYPYSYLNHEAAVWENSACKENINLVSWTLSNLFAFLMPTGANSILEKASSLVLTAIGQVELYFVSLEDNGTYTSCVLIYLSYIAMYYSICPSKF